MSSFDKLKEAHTIVVVESPASSLDEVFKEESRLSRGLKQRHIQMLTLVGVFGTGLLLSSGSTLYLAGNVGMFLSYLFVGIRCGCPFSSLLLLHSIPTTSVLMEKSSFASVY